MVASMADGRAQTAQTAQEIVDRAATVYTSAGSYSAQVTTRDVNVMIFPSDSGAPRYETRSIRYQRILIKLRKPGDWLLIRQNSYSSGGDPMGSGGGSGIPDRVMTTILMKSGATPAKHGSYNGGRTTLREVPEAQFSGLLESRLSGTMGEPDIVLKNFRPSAGVSGNIALGLVNPQIKTEEANATAYCIVAQTTTGRSLTLWIDKGSFLIQRVVAQSTGGMNRFRSGPTMGPPQFSPSGGVSFSETVYDQRISPALGSSDFTTLPPDLDKIDVSQTGFYAIADLVKLATPPAASVFGEPGAQPPSGAVVTPAPTPPPAPVAPTPTVTEQQVLSTEQMEGIVLIDGDEGTATGFMTQIKGVDFVVTNQHVLGENKKIILKNLHGEVVPVLQIFGAVGSDIAIMRIAKGQGKLKLAEDVLKSVKIGDKIVVVGNRLGGGVATQTSGHVLGVGPTRIEVNANFEPGNSGSPIFATGSNEVVGVATYAETRRAAVEESASSNSFGSASPSKVDKRWFGYRLDGITKWEAINMERWHAQGERIEKFRDMSEALVAVIRLNWKKAAANERLATLIGDFEARAQKLGSNRVGMADEVKSLIYNVRNLAESGIRDFESGEYYDYYRTCLYWEESVPMQVEYRKAIVAVLKKYEANSSTYLSKMRNGGGN